DPTTGAETEDTAYKNYIDTFEGAIVAVENFREYDEQKQLPWSELMYVDWGQVREFADERTQIFPDHDGGGPISNLKSVVQAKCTNDQTRAVIQEIWKLQGLEYNTGDTTWYKYVLEDPLEPLAAEWFYSLVGTDNVKGTAWLLNDHAAEIGKKVITEIWVRWTWVDPDIWINVSAQHEVVLLIVLFRDPRIKNVLIVLDRMFDMVITAILKQQVAKGRHRAASALARKPFYSSSTADEVNQNPSNASWQSILNPLDTFPRRHIGPSNDDAQQMLQKLDPPAKSLDDFVNEVLPKDILNHKNLQIKGTPDGQDGFSESQLVRRLLDIAQENYIMKNYIGCGYAGTRVPEVIKRNVLENPAWYTSYTPYQPEISQGRLESLLNFQTMVCDLTGLSIANASVLDEPTAAAEAMTLSLNALPSSRQKRATKTFLVSHLCHPQTPAVLQSRADGFGVKIVVADILADGAKIVKETGDDLIGVLVQYPDTEGGVEDFQNLADIVHDMKATFCVGTDLLALTLLKPPGEFGADIAFGNAQRFGVPLGYGGPHAAFFACNENYKRKIPGRLVGVSKDRSGDKAMRLALQTREQHVRREKATSNICTAQALLANMSAFYAVYHGPKGLQAIAQRARTAARFVEECLLGLGYSTGTRGKGSHGRVLFDTLTVNVDEGQAPKIAAYAADNHRINLRILDDSRLAITLDETVDKPDLEDLLKVFVKMSGKTLNINIAELPAEVPEPLMRTSPFLTHPVFNTHHSETELLRYIHHLQSKDLSLTHSMIPLGSCTMKLNATTEMIPVSWPVFSTMHPFAPVDQAKGYKILIDELEEDLAEITGFHAVSLQPNSGAQGEFTGLRVIRKYQQ
ncbi:MAG: hypothetical protein Q9174_006085, partial [Haloplaca sp. 1 TL-2023]